MNNGLIIDKDGNRWYYLNDRLHREDGPAVEHTHGDKWWYLDGKLHRKDGPAMEWSNGTKVWYLHGKKIKCFSQEEFEKLMKLKAFW